MLAIVQLCTYLCTARGCGLVQGILRFYGLAVLWFFCVCAFVLAGDEVQAIWAGRDVGCVVF